MGSHVSFFQNILPFNLCATLARWLFKLTTVNCAIFDSCTKFCTLNAATIQHIGMIYYFLWETTYKMGNSVNYYDHYCPQQLNQLLVTKAKASHRISHGYGFQAHSKFKLADMFEANNSQCRQKWCQTHVALSSKYNSPTDENTSLKMQMWKEGWRQKH